MKRLLIPFLALGIGMASITQSANAISAINIGKGVGAIALFSIGSILWRATKIGWDRLGKLDAAIENYNKDPRMPSVQVTENGRFCALTEQGAKDKSKELTTLVTFFLLTGTACLMSACFICATMA